MRPDGSMHDLTLEFTAFDNTQSMYCRVEIEDRLLVEMAFLFADVSHELLKL